MSPDTDQRAGPITLRPKMKTCGREDCTACPHGPYWYAILAYTQTPNWHRREVYLGLHWTPADLKAKVLPHLAPALRGELAAWIDEQQARADRAALVEHIETLDREINRVQGEADRELKALGAQRGRLGAELKRIDAQYPPARPTPHRK